MKLTQSKLIFHNLVNMSSLVQFAHKLGPRLETIFQSLLHLTNACMHYWNASRFTAMYHTRKYKHTHETWPNTTITEYTRGCPTHMSTRGIPNVAPTSPKTSRSATQTQGLKRRKKQYEPISSMQLTCDTRRTVGDNTPSTLGVGDAQSAYSPKQTPFNGVSAARQQPNPQTGITKLPRPT